MPIAIVLLLFAFLLAVGTLFLKCEFSKESRWYKTIRTLGAALIVLAAGTFIWIFVSLSNPLNTINNGTYDIQVQQEKDGTSYQYIIFKDKKINLHEILGKNFPDGTKIKVLVYDGYSRGILHSVDGLRFYESILPDPPDSQ